MPDFDYITDDAFRRSLQADWTELESAYGVNAWKAVHVLAGSIVEAAIIDYLEAAQSTHNVQPLKLLDMGLAELVTLSKTHRIITDRTADLSSVVRTYRNLIHPGRARRLGEQVDVHSAGVARSLVEIVVAELEAGKRKLQGYSAKQLLSKIRSDHAVLAILPHLLADMTSDERKRLILETIPYEYMMATQMGNEVPDQHEADRLRRCYRLALDAAEDPIKQEAARRYVKIVKDQSGEYVQEYELAFFRGSDLAHVNPADQALVMSHVLHRLKTSVLPDMLATMDGLFRNLKAQDVGTFAATLLGMIANDRPPRSSAAASALLIREFRASSPEVQASIKGSAKGWIKVADDRSLEPTRRRLDDVRTIIMGEPSPFEDDIPF